MKWVLLSPGNYKLVDDEDERPAVKLPSHKPGKIFTPFAPSWKKYEEGMKHPDSPNQGEYADKFIAEREHQLKVDPQAKKWEESRKAVWAREKPQWVKQLKDD
jgi:hypothetical protein